jgi:tRNA pseudouridine55 synthase
MNAAICRLTGEIDQVPPDYSAKSVDGTRAYSAARKGVALELAPVKVQVHEWKVRSFADDVLEADITCGSGTYIRALARDLGRLTESAAHLQSLRRTRSGPFDVRDAVTLDQLKVAPPQPKTPRVVIDD